MKMVRPAVASATDKTGCFDIQPLEQRLMMSSTPVPLTVYSVRVATGIELRINGTPGNDVITIGRAKNRGVAISTGTGWTRTWTRNSPATIRIVGGDGSDRINVKPNLWTPVVIYGGDGNDTLTGGTGDDRIYGGTGRNILRGAGGNDVIVSIGGSNRDSISGGAGLDSFWTDASPREVVTDVDSAEKAIGAVHRVGAFATPTVSGGSVAGLSSLSSSQTSIELNGRNLSDPTITSAASGYTSFRKDPLFSRIGPNIADVQQGALGDCYLLASLASIAKTDPQVIRQNIADLGDGTYAVRFFNGSTPTFIRVDADLPTTRWGGLAYARLGLQGSTWAAIYEKAYTIFRTGAGSYASIESGFMGDVYEDMGLKSSSTFGASNGQSLLSELSKELNAGEAVTLGTKTSVSHGVPVVTGHAYVVDKVFSDANGTPTSVRLRNPWGIDGAGNDGKNDGYVVLTAQQAMQAFWFSCAAQA